MTGPLLSPEFLQTLDRLSMPTRRGMPGRLAGERRSPRRGSSVEFADFRAYTPGDDIRQIDWNLYGRLERFYLKLYVAEEELTVHLLMDTSASMQCGEPTKLDYARRILAAFGYVALSNGDRVELLPLAASGQSSPPLRGKQRAAELFSYLQHVTAGTALDLRAAVQRAVQRLSAGGPLIFCTDLLTEDWQAVLRALCSRPYDVLVLHVLAPQDVNPSLEGDIRLQDVETGHTVDVTLDAELRNSYRERLHGWLDDVAAYCHQRGIAYQYVESSLPVESLFSERLRRSGVVR